MRILIKASCSHYIRQAHAGVRSLILERYGWMVPFLHFLVLLDCACRLELVSVALLFFYIEKAISFLKLVILWRQCQYINLLSALISQHCLKWTLGVLF